MTQCNTKTPLDFHPDFPVEVEFSADDISHNGGALLLRQAEKRLGICDTIAACIADERDQNRVLHSRKEQVLQRVIQIALGYEDQNDADWLRDDPILKTACDRRLDDEGLSAQSTLCRFENAVDAVGVQAMQWKLIVSWIRNLDDKRREVTLDIDSSAFEGHGQQQQLEFNRFHGCHMLHPLLIFDDETGQLITAIQRPGSAHDLSEANEWIRRIIILLKHLHHRECSVLVRADAGFASPKIYRSLEQLDETLGQISYLIGMARNSVLENKIRPALQQARYIQQKTGQPARVFTDFEYQARSWKHPRHIVAKAEITLRGDNPRFVVTNNLDEFPPRLLYEVGYCGRGRCEQGIGELKGGLKGDRIGCHAFEANGFRLILHTLAYRLLFEIRRTIQAHAHERDDEGVGQDGAVKQLQNLASARFETLRLRLLKVAFIVRQSVRRIFLQGAKSFRFAAAFHHLARAMG